MSNDAKMIKLCGMCSAPVSKEAEASKKCQECGGSFYHYKIKYGFPELKKTTEESTLKMHSHEPAPSTPPAQKQAESNTSESSTENPINPDDLAKYQRLAILGFLSAALCIIPYAFILVIPFQAYCYFKLSCALQIDLIASIALTALMMIPILNLIILLCLNHKAIKELKGHGFKIGIMGAKRSPINQPLS